MKNKVLLEKLIYAIQRVDSGCSHCVEGFIEDANPIIEPLGFKYEK